MSLLLHRLFKTKDSFVSNFIFVKEPKNFCQEPAKLASQ